nr:hypothetical protein [Sphingomonas solaris]
MHGDRGSQLQHRCQLAAQDDGQLAILRRQHHRLDERAQPFERLRLQRLVPERRGELSDLLAIHAAKVGVQQFGLRGCGLRGILFGEQDLPPLGPDLHLLDEHRRIDALQDGRLGEADLTVEVCQLDLTLGAGADRLGHQPLHLRFILGQECHDDIVAQHLGRQPRQDTRVEVVLADRQPVVAPGRPLLGGALTPEPALARFGIARAATAAGHLAGQQIPGALLREEGQGRGLRCGCPCQRCLPRLHPLPQIHGHDAQFGHFDGIRPLLLWVDECLAFPGVGVLAVGLFAVGAPAGIEWVVEEAGAPRGITGQRIRRPGRCLAGVPPASLAAAWRWYALGVQPPRDGDG